MRRVVRVESVGERDRIKELERELKRLKHVLGEERIRGILGEKYLEIACQRGGLGPVENFKKSTMGCCRPDAAGGCLTWGR
jgi:DNA anti-recombination protein RmuC